MTKRRDHALDWITRWNQAAPASLKARLVELGMTPRHQEHPDGEVLVVPGRRYRFDWAIPELLVAVEIDGGNYMARWSKKAKRCVVIGRHTQTVDYEKRNLASAAGWVVFAFTTEMLQDNATACVARVADYIERRIAS